MLSPWQRQVMSGVDVALDDQLFGRVEYVTPAFALGRFGAFG